MEVNDLFVHILQSNTSLVWKHLKYHLITHFVGAASLSFMLLHSLMGLSTSTGEYIETAFLTASNCNKLWMDATMMQKFPQPLMPHMNKGFNEVDTYHVEFFVSQCSHNTFLQSISVRKMFNCTYACPETSLLFHHLFYNRFFHPTPGNF